MKPESLSRFTFLPSPPCIRHSHLKQDHPELSHDVLAIPDFYRGRHTQKWLVTGGCICVLPLVDGTYDSEAEARAAWQAIVEGQMPKEGQ